VSAEAGEPWLTILAKAERNLAIKYFRIKIQNKGFVFLCVGVETIL
jgi:hypothetical protein